MKQCRMSKAEERRPLIPKQGSERRRSRYLSGKFKFAALSKWIARRSKVADEEKQSLLPESGGKGEEEEKEEEA